MYRCTCVVCSCFDYTNEPVTSSSSSIAPPIHKMLDCDGGTRWFPPGCARRRSVLVCNNLSRSARVIGVERGELCSFVSIHHCVYCCCTSTTLCASVRTMGAGRDDRLSLFFSLISWLEISAQIFKVRAQHCNSGSGSGGVSSSFWFGWRGMLRGFFFWFTCVATTSSQQQQQL